MAIIAVVVGVMALVGSLFGANLAAGFERISVGSCIRSQLVPGVTLPREILDIVEQCTSGIEL